LQIQKFYPEFTGLVWGARIKKLIFDIAQNARRHRDEAKSQKKKADGLGEENTVDRPEDEHAQKKRMTSR
jgi:rubrerythrin